MTEKLTDDDLKRAEELGKPETTYRLSEVYEILPKLVNEVKRLRENETRLHREINIHRLANIQLREEFKRLRTQVDSLIRDVPEDQGIVIDQ